MDLHYKAELLLSSMPKVTLKWEDLISHATSFPAGQQLADLLFLIGKFGRVSPLLLATPSQDKHTGYYNSEALCTWLLK